MNSNIYYGAIALILAILYIEKYTDFGLLKERIVDYFKKLTVSWAIVVDSDTESEFEVDEDELRLLQLEEVRDMVANFVFNYGFHREKDIEEFQKQPDIINLAQYDYSFVREDGTDNKMPELISTTELASYQNLEDMEEFYRQKHPNLPDEYFGINNYSPGHS